MTENLSIWDRFADIDPAFTKKITGKAYQGTSPNPQYVIRCLTEIFGPVGKGFGWEVLHEGFEPLGDEILHWCRIRFWHTERSNFFESYGQTKALMKTRNGLMSDEDAPKKSLTDAIIKASSHIGIAANIFLGRWDDQKYVQSVADSFDARNEPAAAPVKSSAQLKRDNFWPDFERELLECTTLLMLEKFKTAWRKKAIDDGWNAPFKAAAKDRIEGQEKSILDAMDAEELATVPLDKALQHSIQNHPLMAGE